MTVTLSTILFTLTPTSNQYKKTYNMKLPPCFVHIIHFLIYNSMIYFFLQQPYDWKCSIIPLSSTASCAKKPAAASMARRPF